MTLLKTTLSISFLDIFTKLQNGLLKVSYPPNPPPPNTPKEVCSAIANAYHSWASLAMAGTLKISSPGLKTALQTSLMLPSLNGLGTGFASYWAPVIFSGPGFIPANPVMPTSVSLAASGISSDILDFMNQNKLKGGSSSKTLQEASDKLASILYSWTIKLQVLAITTSTPPVASTLPVS